MSKQVHSQLLSTFQNISGVKADETTLCVDPQLYRMKENQGISLPPRLLLKVWDDDRNIYCIVDVKQTKKAEFPSMTFYTFSLVEHPLLLVKDLVWKTDHIVYWRQIHPYIRPPTESWHESWLVINLHRTGNYVEFDDKTFLHEYKLIYPARVLGQEFSDIQSGNDTTFRWHFVAGPDHSCFRRSEERLPSKMNIPQHIFTSFVNQAIEKKEVCPISMDVLTKQNVASTPCGHLFQYDSLKKALETTEKCPTCRAKCKVDEIQYR